MCTDFTFCSCLVSPTKQYRVSPKVYDVPDLRCYESRCVRTGPAKRRTGRFTMLRPFFTGSGHEILNFFKKLTRCSCNHQQRSELSEMWTRFMYCRLCDDLFCFRFREGVLEAKQKKGRNGVISYGLLNIPGIMDLAWYGVAFSHRNSQNWAQHRSLNGASNMFSLLEHGIHQAPASGTMSFLHATRNSSSRH